METGEGDLADALGTKIQVITNLWTLVDSGAELPTATLTVELLLFIGDNFQEKDASLKFTVEALQRNATPSNAGNNVEHSMNSIVRLISAMVMFRMIMILEVILALSNNYFRLDKKTASIVRKI